jgi:hypothetical protein
VASEAIPDLKAWEAYCENCHAFREVRRAEACDASDNTEYFEFLCNTCHSILLTFQRLGTQSAEAKPARRLRDHETLRITVQATYKPRAAAYRVRVERIRKWIIETGYAVPWWSTWP